MYQLLIFSPDITVVSIYRYVTDMRSQLPQTTKILSLYPYSELYVLLPIIKKHKKGFFAHSIMETQIGLLLVSVFVSVIH